MSAKRVIQAAVLFVFLAGLWFAVITLFPVQLSRMAFAPTHGFEPLPALTARASQQRKGLNFTDHFLGLRPR